MGTSPHERVPPRTARGVAQLALLAMFATLTACGGGTGTEGPAPEPASVQFGGRVLAIGADGAPVAAPAGVPVRLVELDASGSALRELASTATTNDGRYTLSAPAGIGPSLVLAVERTDADGTALRGLALAADVEVSAASEAFTREMLAARQARGAVPDETLERLARFQRASLTFLGLVDLHARDTNDAVAELRDWIADDEASVQAWQALASTGRLPSTLADIGALYGLASEAAWESSTPEGSHELAFLRFRHAAGEFDFHLRDEESEAMLRPPRTIATLRLENDGATWIVTRLKTQGGLVGEQIAHLLGPIRMAEFGAPLGVTERLTSKSGQTWGMTFDADNREDAFSFTSDRRVVGTESVIVDDRPVRALRIESADVFAVTLSGGGTLRSETTTVSWHVPLVGAIRTRTTLTVTGPGAPLHTTVVERLDRAVVNRHVWPGRVRVRAVAVPWDDETEGLHPIAVSPNRTLVYADRADTTWQTTLRLVDIDSGAIKARVDLPVEFGARSFVRLSPDGRKLYAAVSRRAPGSGQDMPLAEAERHGGLVLRLDPGSLDEELRVSMPPHPSSFFPGRGFPRSTLDELLVSPTDPTQFVVGSIGALLFRGTEPAPVALTDPSAESVYHDYSVIHTASVQPFAWDPVAGELRLRYRPHLFWSHPPEDTYAVPIAPDGLHLGALRSLSATTPDNGIERWQPHVNDRFIGDRILLGDFSALLDRSSGAVLVGDLPMTGGAFFGSACTARENRILCLGKAELVERDASTLEILSRRSLHADLASRAAIPPMPSGALAFGAVSAYEYVAAYGSSRFPGVPTLYRIKVSPR